MATLPSSGQRLPADGTAERALAAAFQDFNQAAGLLERSYADLRGELARLRRELRRKNQENSAMRARLETILASLPCGVVVVEGGRVQAINGAAQKLITPWGEPGVEAGQELPPCLVSALETPNGEEFCLEAEQGEPHSLGVTVAPLEASGGAPENRLLILRDTTLERKRQRGQALAEMSALLAHEIRNPLAGMELFASLLAEATEDGTEEKSWIEQLQAGLRLLAATVNNVLHLYSEPAVELAPLRLKRFLRATIEFLQPLAQQRQLALELDDRLGAVEVAADGPRLQQVLFNLALNAMRAMAASGGCLQIVALPGATGQIRIEIVDQGCGIAAEDLAKIFEPGFSTLPGSPGLGLAVCRKIMDQHHGTISVASQPGEGTTFALTLWRWGAAA